MTQCHHRVSYVVVAIVHFIFLPSSTFIWTNEKVAIRQHLYRFLLDMNRWDMSPLVGMVWYICWHCPNFKPNHHLYISILPINFNSAILASLTLPSPSRRTTRCSSLPRSLSTIPWSFPIPIALSRMFWWSAPPLFTQGRLPLIQETWRLDVPHQSLKHAPSLAGGRTLLGLMTTIFPLSCDAPQQVDNLFGTTLTSTRVYFLPWFPIATLCYVVLCYVPGMVRYGTMLFPMELLSSFFWTSNTLFFDRPTTSLQVRERSGP